MFESFSLPPIEYDHPYHGELVVNYVMSPDEMNRRCYGTSLQIVGCAFLGDGHCTILILDGVVPKVRDILLRHEIGHCNGWPRDHPR